MEIYQLPALTNNYIFLLHDPATQTAIVVDPGEPFPVLRQLRQLNVPLVAIWNTHRHGDHIGGNWDLLDAYPGIPVYGSAIDRGKIPGQTVFLKAGDQVSFAGRTADVLAVPGHLDGHIAYYFPPTLTADGRMTGGELFSGDVIFSAGCGKIFDGPYQKAVQSVDRLRQLPDATRVWCAHEYTLVNLKFAQQVEPDNPDLQAWAIAAQKLRDADQPTVPTTIGKEKRINPFLRWDIPTVQQAMQRQIPAEVFAELRRRKEAM